MYGQSHQICTIVKQKQQLKQLCVTKARNDDDDEIERKKPNTRRCKTILVCNDSIIQRFIGFEWVHNVSGKRVVFFNGKNRISNNMLAVDRWHMAVKFRDVDARKTLPTTTTMIGHEKLAEDMLFLGWVCYGFVSVMAWRRVFDFKRFASAYVTINRTLNYILAC